MRSRCSSSLCAPSAPVLRRRIRLVLIRVREGDGASEGRDPTLLSGLLPIRTHELSEESDDECVDKKNVNGIRAALRRGLHEEGEFNEK